MSKSMMKWTLGLLAVGCMLAIAAPAGAEVIQQKDSAAFDWCYEMEVLGVGKRPSETDLDGNSTMDFHEIDTGGGSSSVSDDGVLTIVCDTGSKHLYFVSDAALELWPLEEYSYKRGYTLEIRMRKGTLTVPGTQGTKGFCMIGAGPEEADTTDVFGYITNAGIGWHDGTAYIALDTTDNNADGNWHTFRFAQEANPDGAAGNERFSVWRDDVLVGKDYGDGEGLVTSLTGLAIIGDMIKFGDFGSAQKGTFDVDYLRFTDGAYAPIPEPSTLILLAGGLLSLVLWRRR